MLVRKQLKTSFKTCHFLSEEVTRIVKDSGVANGYCLVSLDDQTVCLGITSFFDPRGLQDIMNEIDRSFPARVHRHNQISTYDAAGRIKNALIGSSALLLVKDGRLILGSSQGLVLIETDGPQERSYTVLVKEVPLKTRKHGIDTVYMGMHDLTEQVTRDIKESGIENGICHISMLHSTAGLLLCDKSETGKRNIMEDIERMVPTRGDFLHRETASDAGGHIKTAFTDSQLTLIIEEGKPVLGEEQAIVFAEYDGPRPRSYTVGLLERK